MKHFFDLAFTPDVLARQQAKGSFEHYGAGTVTWPTPAGLGPDEQAFITERDSISECISPAVSQALEDGRWVWGRWPTRRTRLQAGQV